MRFFPIRVSKLVSILASHWNVLVSILASHWNVLVSILASHWNVSHKADNACRILVADLGRWDFLHELVTNLPCI
jgi:hypothetical protein